MRLRKIVLLFIATLVLNLSARADGIAGEASRVFHPAHERNWRGAQTHALIATIWYPAAAGSIEKPRFIGRPDAPAFLAGNTAVDAPLASTPAKFPVILLSHGTGGSAMQLAWLGPELARNGYIVAAINHPGNNGLEPYTAEGFTLWWERATDISDSLDQLLLDPTFGPHIDQARIGAAGFSLGGYTVLALAGARIHQSAFLAFCEANPQAATCHIAELRDLGSIQQVLATTRASSAESLARSGASYRDARIRAVFAIAPAVGQSFSDDSFREVRIPVALVVGDRDPIAPAAANATYFKQLYPRAELSILRGGVTHYTFLDTCAPAAKATSGAYCQDAATVDRDVIHRKVAAMAIQFFAANLH